ncbi:GloB Zn-dependent hydrolases, including glyoxylases [Burkholderiaceae bacterium]|jgi:glyoxylase-like metal-dependent hydrolase (beta-lactamase superfamily II)
MPNSTNLEIQYPLGEALPASGEALEVAPGVRWLRMRLPFALDHINLWLLRDEIEGVAGWTIIDCGISNAETQTAWEAIFSSQLGGLPVLRVIATHMHPDHVGLAYWLCERWQAPLWMSMSDYLTAQWLSNQEGGAAIGAKMGGGGSADHLERHGLNTAEDLALIRGRSDYYIKLVPRMPPRYRRMMDGDLITIGGQLWQVQMGYGHAPEHATLYCAKLGVFISGDMVLPRISTNISVYDGEPDADPLGLFLRSLALFAKLPANTLVLPSHGKPFTGLHLRIQQLQDHHVDRLADTMKACQVPITARDLVPILFKRALDTHQLTFAMGEAIAHLNHLWRLGKLTRKVSAGVWQFSVH